MSAPKMAWSLASGSDRIEVDGVESSDAATIFPLESAWFRPKDDGALERFQVRTGEAKCTAWSFSMELAAVGERGYRLLRQWLESSKPLTLNWKLPVAPQSAWSLTAERSVLSSVSLQGLKPGEMPRIHIELLPESIQIVPHQSAGSFPRTMTPRAQGFGLEFKKITLNRMLGKLEPTVVMWQPYLWSTGSSCKAARGDIASDTSHLLRTPKLDKVGEYDSKPLSLESQRDYGKFFDRMQQIQESVSYEFYVDEYVSSQFFADQSESGQWIDAVEDFVWLLMCWPRLSSSKSERPGIFLTSVQDIEPLASAFPSSGQSQFKPAERDGRWRVPKKFIHPKDKSSAPEKEGVLSQLIHVQLPHGQKVLVTPTRIVVERVWMNSDGETKLCKIRVDGVLHRDGGLIA